jgi:hypothetical protein
VTPETHEDLSRTMPHQTSSNRSFGIVFAVVFLCIGLWPLVRGAMVHVAALACSGVFFGCAFFVPSVLTLPKRAWLALGGLLQRITTPIALAVLFFGVVTPVGLLMRVVGRRPLALKRENELETYWVARVPPGPTAESLRRQF